MRTCMMKQWRRISMAVPRLHGKRNLQKNVITLQKIQVQTKDFLEKILNQISKYETLDDILHAIHKLSLAIDACFHCVWLKHKVPEIFLTLLAFPSY